MQHLTTKKNHGTRRKPYRVEIGRAQVKTVNAAEWNGAVARGWILPIEGADRSHLARLAKGVHAVIVQGDLVLSKLDPSIPSSWRRFEEAWRKKYSTHKAKDFELDIFERRRRVLVERQSEIDLDNLLWRFTLRSKRANCIRFVSEAQRAEVVNALRPAA